MAADLQLLVLPATIMGVHSDRGGAAVAGKVIDAIPSCAGLEFAADDVSIAYTTQDAAGRPSQVCLTQTAC